MKQSEIITSTTTTAPSIDALRMSESLGVGHYSARRAVDLRHIEDCPGLRQAQLAARLRWLESYAVGGYAVEALEGEEGGYRFRLASTHVATLFRLRFYVGGRTRTVKKG